MSFPSGGFNPRFGRDNGGAPPANPYPGGMAPTQSSPWGLFPQPPPPRSPYAYPGNTGMSYGQPYVPYGEPYVPYGAPSPYGTAFSPMAHPAAGRVPGPYPRVDPDMPATNMTNSTGGVGCEPGYAYWFPPEHCKIHVLRTGSSAPWQLPANFTMAFTALHVPVTATVGDLLAGFGATNPVAKKNKITEVVAGGGGQWYKGMGFNGESAACEKPIKSFGWDGTRTGLPGEKPVVYLYVEKD